MLSTSHIIDVHLAEKKAQLTKHRVFGLACGFGRVPKNQKMNEVYQIESKNIK